jgi:hypothetical protein
VTYLAYLAGVGALVMFAAIVVGVQYSSALRDQAGGRHSRLVRETLRRRVGLLRLIEGADGRLSTSKAQWLAWLVVIVFAYVVIYTARAINGDPSALDDIPRSVLVALGFSSGTMAGAKGITAYYVATGRMQKTRRRVAADGQTAADTAGGTAADSDVAPAAPPTPRTATPAQTWRSSDLMQDDSGDPDLSKVQLLIWTVIALGVYLGTVIAAVNDIAVNGVANHNGALPDIDAALMVLMGLSQGGYVGKKLVTYAPVKLQTLAPPNQFPGGSVAAYGSGFGATRGEDSRLLLNGFDCAPQWISDWSDNRITFTLNPAAAPSGQPWTSPLPSVDVTVQVGSQVSDPPLRLTVTERPPGAVAAPRTRPSTR